MKFLILILAVCIPAVAQAQTVTKPPAGSPERKRIMDDLRIARGTPDQVFVVTTLKVSGDWAYAVINPQARKGSQKFETESVLLKRQGGHWAIAGNLCTEDDLKDDMTCDLEKSIARVRRETPGVPSVLFR